MAISSGLTFVKPDHESESNQSKRKKLVHSCGTTTKLGCQQEDWSDDCIDVYDDEYDKHTCVFQSEIVWAKSHWLHLLVFSSNVQGVPF